MGPTRGDRARPRAGAQRLAVTSGGTIPDRGLYGVFLPDGTRVGELDEEMVYESRVGETFLLGASTWRIEDITFERVVVTPAPGQPGKMPFWHGDGPGREAELGRAMGEFVREIRSMPGDAALERLHTRHALDDRAADQPARLPGRAVRGDRCRPRRSHAGRRTVPRRDRRLAHLHPLALRRQVHAPWATIIRTRLDQHFADDLGNGFGAEVLWSDDGIVVRLPEAAQDLPLELILPDPDEVEAEVVAVLPGTAAFAARFREAAARALLLPRRRPDQRTPLWQQRQRAADLLAVASKYPSFPILLEATRECCNDIFDLPALRRVMTEVRSRHIRVVEVETPIASPFARSLLFGWIAVFMYEGDAPLAERRAAALSLDRELLRDLLGAEELRSLLDAEVVDQVEMELQRLTPERAARDADELHDLLRVLGPLSELELSARVGEVPTATMCSWVEELLERRRVIEVGDRRRAAVRRCRGRGPAARRPGRRHPRRSAGGVHRPGRARVGRPGRAVRSDTRPVHLGAAGRSVGSHRRGRGTVPEGAGQFRAGGVGGVPSRWCRAPSGATPRCCGACDVVRSPCCAKRSNRSMPRPWPGSCRVAERRLDTTWCGRAWPRSSGCCRAQRSLPR